MRIYASCHEMHSEVKRDLHEMGVIVHPQTMQDKNVADDPAYTTRELSPCVFTIQNGLDRDAMIQDLGLNLAWCYEELRERLATLRGEGPVNPGLAWQLRQDVWSEFLHDGSFAYTYSERFGRAVHHLGLTPLQMVVHELRERPDTRQAVLPVFDANIDFRHLGGIRRVPCSMFYQFLRRRNELVMTYSMRSSDFITHFPYDIWLALGLQKAVAEAVGDACGPLTFFSGSLHIYQKDEDLGVF